MLDSLSGQRPRYIIPALGRLYASLSDFAWLVLRVTVGGSLIPHGMQKLFMAFSGPGMDKFIASLAARGFPAPTLMGWLVALTEFVGGTLLSAAQVSALTSAGCKRVFEDKASAGRWDGPERHRLLDQLA